MAGTTRRGLFYSKTYTCQLDRAQFNSYKLYPSPRRDSERLEEYFDVPYYESPASGEFNNQLFMDVRVCPQCGFASADDTHFETGSDSIIMFDFEDRLKAALMKQSPLRMKEYEKAGGSLDKCPRSAEDAVIAYKMAILTSTVMFKFNERRYGGETVRLAAYALKLGRIAHQTGQPERVDAWRKAAFEFLTKGFEADVKGPARFKGLYQLAALGIYFEQDKLPIKVLMILRDLVKQEPGRDVNRYKNRVQEIWDNRDMHRRVPPVEKNA